MRGMSPHFIYHIFPIFVKIYPKLSLDPYVPLWMLICLLGQSRSQNGQVLQQILTRLSEPRQELGTLKSNLLRKEANLAWFTSDCHVPVLLASISF